jgi:hypothetical protein
MAHLAILLNSIGIQFDAKKNYIHCFAHMISLCYKAVIRQMERDNDDDTHSDTDTENGTETGTDDDTAAVNFRQTPTTRKAGPIRQARRTVAFILTCIIQHSN